MKVLVPAILAFALCVGVATAQTAAPAMPAPTAPAAATPAAGTPVASDLTKDGKVRMKIVRAQCRDEVKASGAKGEARRDAMGACVVKARPDKAAEVKCAMDPQTKGMAKEARHAFVKDCVAKAKG